MKRMLRYINPIAQLGSTKYSFFFPFFSTLLLCVLSEIFAYQIAKDPMAVGAYIIFLTLGFILYFSFRDGIKGGVISSLISIGYFFYIVYSRNYSPDEFTRAIYTIVVLGTLYLVTGVLIGWLKQRIDKLIENEAEEKKRLETIIQQLPVGILITDSTGAVVQRNKQADSILGVKIPYGFVIGKDTLVDEKINGKKIEPADASLAIALKTGKAIINKELTFQRKDGKEVYLQVSSAPIHNKKRKIIAAVSIISDVSEQKELERQKDDFLSMASHELKTPLTSLKMFVDLQSIEVKKKSYKRVAYYNERIRDQANRLKELANDLLDVSRVQTGKLRFHKEEFDISQVISDTVEAFQETAKSHEFIVKNMSHEMVIGDRYRIYQVLVNLLSNAVKYSEKGKKIIVSVEKTKKEVIVSVKDFGIGIEKDQQKKIFERLYQVTSPTEKTFPGLGLGLYISKEIMDRHHGKLYVKSTKGKGSTFYFSLPLQVTRKVK